MQQIKSTILLLHYCYKSNGVITMYVIKTKGLTKRYKDIIAVDNLNLEIRKGEVFALLGVNGAGKTTTIKMLTCIAKSTSGDAFLNGISVTKNVTDVKRMIGVSPQETAVASGLTVRENLEMMCGIYNFPKKTWESKIAELAALLQLDKIIHRKAGQLSGGWQRRLSIAMALISEPQILFLDEPTLGLDVLSRSDLWDIIRTLKGKITIVLTTHYMEEAETLSDRIGIMKDGKLLICDTAENIKKIAGQGSFEQAFIHIVRETIK